jgi:hypothetical protein
MKRIAFVIVLAACEQSSSPPPTPRGHLELVPAPMGGDIKQNIVDAIALAAKDHKQLIVYEGATWCEPCRQFHDAAAAGQLDRAFPTLRVLAFDEDQDGAALANIGYTSEMIPLFAIPNPDGTASGKQIEGSIKGDGAVANITPRLQKLLAP